MYVINFCGGNLFFSGGGFQWQVTCWRVIIYFRLWVPYRKLSFYKKKSIFFGYYFFKKCGTYVGITSGLNHWYSFIYCAIEIVEFPVSCSVCGVTRFYVPACPLNKMWCFLTEGIDKIGRLFSSLDSEKGSWREVEM